jgi:outer membrane protein
MKTKILTAMLLGTAMTPIAASAQNVPAAIVAIVDTARVTTDCTACKSATTQIQALVTQGQARAQALTTPLQTEGQAIQQAAEALGKQAPGPARTTAETALRTRAQAFEAKQQAAQRELAGLQQNIQSVQANVSRQVMEKLNPIIGQTMTARGANIALDQQATLAAAKSVDVTDQVLASLNAALPSVSVTPLPAAPRPAGTPPPPPGR